VAMPGVIPDRFSSETIVNCPFRLRELNIRDHRGSPAISARQRRAKFLKYSNYSPNLFFGTSDSAPVLFLTLTRVVRSH